MPLIETILPVGKLFLLPSDAESFGLAALEAMACGLPVIGTNVGGLPEVVESSHMDHPDFRVGGKIFALLAEIARRHDVAGLSMGMSADFETAVTAEDLAVTIHAHPTLSEGLMEAAESLLHGGDK